VFTGLAVALAIHAGLFNIGGEGQAYLGGLGAALVLLAFDASLPPALAVALAVIAAAAFGAAWAAIPAWLQASRGSHIVITTIMFNFIASALMVYLLVNVLIVPGSMSPESREFAASTRLPFIHELVGLTGIAIAPSPLNISVFLAIACCVLVWVLLWRTSWGYELRAIGHNAEAAVYAGVNRWRMTLVVMSLSGALAGLVGVNEILGVHHRLILNFTAGYGFGGIAVALMGRNHPLGVALSSLLFGALYQGGAELSFEIPAITREMVVVIQGLVILFSGALANLFRPAAERLIALWPRAAGPATIRLGRP
jgi:simple sugar transport system permease protein